MNQACRIVVSICTAAVLCCPAIPQQAVPPPPKPADAGPSLEVTLQFIADKINEIGTVNFISSFQNTQDGSTGSNSFSETFSSARAAPADCIVSYHVKVSRDGQQILDQDAGIPMRQVQDVAVMPWEQYISSVNAKFGHPELIPGSTSPAVTVVLARRLHNAGENFLLFTDATLADRVAKAINHAVELCGGGSKDPF